MSIERFEGVLLATLMTTLIIALAIPLLSPSLAGSLIVRDSEVVGKKRLNMAPLKD